MAELYQDIPELGAQERAILRRQKIAEQLMSQSQRPLEINQMAGGYVIPQGPLEGISKIFQAYAAKKEGDDAEKAYGGLANKRAAMVAEELAKVQGIQQGSPAIDAQMRSEFEGGQPSIQTTQEAQPAVAGDPRKAVMQAMMSNIPELQKYGTIGMNDLNRKEDLASTQAARAQETQLAREARAQELELRLQDSRLNQADRLAMQKELAVMNNDARVAMANQASEDRRAMAEQVSADRRYAVDSKPLKAGDTAPDGRSLTVGEKAVDRNFGKEYAEYQAGGGSADVEKQLQQLQQVSNDLGTKGNDYTGPSKGLIPDKVRAFTNPEAVAAKNKVEEVAQRNLRAVLGAQFTQVEGERLIARAYNPQLSPTENKRRVDALITQIRNAAQTKESAARHFEENGTLAGWSGRIPSLTDFDNAIDNANKPPKAATKKPSNVRSEADKILGL